MDVLAVTSGVRITVSKLETWSLSQSAFHTWFVAMFEKLNCMMSVAPVLFQRTLSLFNKQFCTRILV